MWAVAEPPRESLACDKALSLRQFRRRWPGVDPAGLEGVVLVEHTINEATWRRKFRVAFVALEEAAALPDFALRHLAGVAEMRYALKARCEDWYSDAARVHLDATPDAVWYTQEGPCAVEYDLGYARADIRRKHAGFSRMYARQFWGVAIPSRLNHLKRLLPQEPRVRVLLAPWYGDGD